MITICFVYFKSLAIANLAAALYSLRRQDLTHVAEIVIVDNDTPDSYESIQAAINVVALPVPLRLLSVKHGDVTKTHSWSTNLAVGEAQTPWVLFTRADYILDEKLVEKLAPCMWRGDVFATSHGYHLGVDVGVCENQSDWRYAGASRLNQFPGEYIRYSAVDSGVWLMPRKLFNKVGGLDETLTAWGHAQTDFQHRLFKAGVEFVVVPEVLFYHPLHAAERDINLAHQQLRDKGADLHEMWKRSEERVY